MGKVPGIITQILNKIDYCEFCDVPFNDVETPEVYIIDRHDINNTGDLSKNIIVLCPGCKSNYNDGIFSKKHLKACVMLRKPETREWLKNKFDQYDISLKQSTVKKEPVNRFLDKALSKLINNQANLDGAIFLFGILIIIIGILLFSYGYNNVSNYDNGLAGKFINDAGQYSLEYKFSLIIELAGVALAFIGLLFEMRMVKTRKA